MTGVMEVAVVSRRLRWSTDGLIIVVDVDGGSALCHRIDGGGPLMVVIMVDDISQ